MIVQMCKTVKVELLGYDYAQSKSQLYHVLWCKNVLKMNDTNGKNIDGTKLETCDILNTLLVKIYQTEAFQMLNPY